MNRTGRAMVLVGVVLVAAVFALAGCGKDMPKDTAIALSRGVKMEFVLIQPGSFMMGSNDGSENERPAHTVTIAKPFYIGKYEVTQAQWQAVMGNNPSRLEGDNRPVKQVSWDDCRQFAQKVGQGVRLPSESEWEYACRAGSGTPYYWGDSMDDGYCWYGKNSGGSTHPVGHKRPNRWGLFDMSGNVWEWCQDNYHADYVGAPLDGSAWEGSPGGMLRGGSWYDDADLCRSSARLNFLPGNMFTNIGFRLVRTP